MHACMYVLDLSLYGRLSVYHMAYLLHQVLYVPDADADLEEPKSAPACMESRSFTESVETIQSSSNSHVSVCVCVCVCVCVSSCMYIPFTYRKGNEV